MADKKVLVKIILGIITILLLAWLIIPTLSFAEDRFVNEDITVTNVWTKPTLKGQAVGAAYLTIENAGDKTLGLVSAESSHIGRIEIHTHIHKEGMMQMRQLPRLDILPGAKQVMEPGGLHLMLFDMTEPLVEGNEFPIRLTFSDGSSLRSVIQVKQPE